MLGMVWALGLPSRTAGSGAPLLPAPRPPPEASPARLGSRSSPSLSVFLDHLSHSVLPTVPGTFLGGGGP